MSPIREGWRPCGDVWSRGPSSGDDARGQQGGIRAEGTAWRRRSGLGEPPARHGIWASGRQRRARRNVCSWSRPRQPNPPGFCPGGNGGAGAVAGGGSAGGRARSPASAQHLRARDAGSGPALFTATGRFVCGRPRGRRFMSVVSAWATSHHHVPRGLHGGVEGPPRGTRRAGGRAGFEPRPRGSGRAAAARPAGPEGPSPPGAEEARRPRAPGGPQTPRPPSPGGGCRRGTEVPGCHNRLFLPRG